MGETREQGTGMAAGAVVKDFPFRGAVGPGESASVRWADRKAGSVEVGPPAVSLVCVRSSRRTTSSDLADGSKLPARPPSPEPQAFACWGRLLDVPDAIPVPCSLFPVPFALPFAFLPTAQKNRIQPGF